MSDAVDKELKRLGVFPGRASKATASLDPFAEKGELPPEQYVKMLKDVGPKVFKALENTISSPGYKNMPDRLKRKRLENLISSIRKSAAAKYRYKR